MKLWRLVVFLAAALASAPLHATTWYVRPDGGTRWSENAKDGQCDGKTDAAYRGRGTNQHCAFNDYRFLWDDQHTYGKTAWVIAGGDTVILRGGPWRVGFDQNKTANDHWCIGGNGTFSCTNPVLPAGTAEHHTRLLGENYAACSSNGKMTEIFGGFGVGVALNLSGAQYVDVQCLNITRHSECVSHGDPMYPAQCRKDTPVDDFDSDGITTDVHTHDLLLQDLWIHGHTDRGIIGPIGGVVTARHVNIGYNGMAGWDLDDGHSTPSQNATLNLLDSVVEWNGCNQQYPARDPNPVVSCYGQSNGGYGDGMGTPAGMGLDVNIDHSIFRYNTQDGEDFGHVDTGSYTLHLTNSSSYGNNGGQFKWGGNFTHVVFANNTAVGNCLRLSQPMPGTPATYNAHLGDFCRAQDAVSFNFQRNATVLFDNNTIVTYAPTSFDLQCWDGEKNCSGSRLLFRNNIVLGYSNPGTYSLGGKPGGPGGFYTEGKIGTITRSNNVFYGLRNVHCVTTEICADPKFVGEPNFAHESDLDHFNFQLAPGSPAIHAGMHLPDLKTDANGKPRPQTGNYSIGALEPGTP